MEDKITIQDKLNKYTKALDTMKYQIETIAKYDADDDIENLDKELLKLLRKNEQTYYEIKKIIYEEARPFGDNSDTPLLQYGALHYYSPTLSKKNDNYYVFSLPPMYSIKRKDAYGDSKHVYFVILKLIQDAIEKYGWGYISKIEDPVIFMIHHINSEVRNIFDYDNVDSKKTIDALKGYFFDDDNVINLMVNHSGVLDERDFCELHIMSKKDVKSALSVLEEN